MYNLASKSRSSFNIRRNLSLISIFTGLVSSPVLVDANDLIDKSVLTKRGITPFAVLTTDVFTNLSGGNETGTSIFGVLEAGVDLDLEQLTDLSGTSFHISGLWAGGEDPSVNTGDFNTLSNIAAPDSIYFYEAWLEKYWLSGKIRIRVGQMAIDSDFMGSEYGASFINSAFGMLPTISGNTAVSTYPLGAPGALIQYKQTDTTYLQLGIYDGDAGSDQEHGVDYDFGSKEGAAIVYEAGINTRIASELEGAYKLGGMYHTGDFTEFRDGSTVHDNYKFYLVADQMVFKTYHGDPRLAAFLRASCSPKDDRNTVDYHVETGINLFSPLAGRENDILGAGYFYTDFSSDAVRDLRLTEPYVHGAEQVVEIFYQAQVASWFIIKPEFQFILDPMFGKEDAIVFGTRFEITF